MDMVDISKSKSWHYQLYRYTSNLMKGPIYVLPWKGDYRTDPELPNSLCPYAWVVLLSALGAVMLVILFIPALMVGYGILLVMVGVYNLTRRGYYWVDDFLARSLSLISRPPRPPRPEKQKIPSLVLSYIKARKARVCPPIRLVD